MTTSQEILRGFIDRDGLGLEIGPLHRGIAPKREGYRVEILDHSDTDSLHKKYEKDPLVDHSMIEEVDHVSDGISLLQTINQRERYDWILASHVIEHVTDLIGFLNDCDALLRPGGSLVLAVPDKRFCFDARRPLSTVGQILQAHHERRTRHPPGVVFDHVASFVRRAGLAAWSEGQPGELMPENTLEQAYSLFQQAATDDTYHDVHGWVFSPSSFRLAIQSLRRLDLVPLREDEFRPTYGCEFFITLSRSGAGCPIEPDELVRRIDEELLAVQKPQPGAEAPRPEAPPLPNWVRTAAMIQDRVGRLWSRARGSVGTRN